MDHLLRQEGAESIIKVTYHADESEYYDSNGSLGLLDFLFFPERKGWTEEDLLGSNNFGNRCAEDVERFFHTWLYFGMAIEILRAAGLSVQTQDFLRSEPETTELVVTTERLPSMLVQCKNFQRKGDYKASYTTQRILERVGEFIDRYCTRSSDPHEEQAVKKNVWPIRDEVSTSILALGYTLHVAMPKIYNIPGMGGKWSTGSSSLLREVIGKKWCKSDAAMVMDQLQIDGQYYIATSRSPSEEYLEAHSVCGEIRCVSKVKEGTYKTKEAPGCDKNCNTDFCYGNSGEDGDADPRRVPSKFEGRLTEIIREGGTPIIQWNEGQEEVTITEYNEAKGSKLNYVAISHVWLDGMGNQNTNSLPRCQLSRIQRMVDDVPLSSRQEGEKIGFWMDTLCVPVRKAFNQEKKASIRRMRRIYEEAAAVLVIDSWIYQIKSTAPAADRCLAVYQSNWQRRLWTYQEGCLAKQLYFQLSDKSLYCDDLSDTNNAYDAEASTKYFYGNFYQEALFLAVSAHQIVKGVAPSYVGGGDSFQQLWILYLPLADALGHRQTTKLSDETLCLSSILGIDPKPYLDIHPLEGEPDESLAERRMEALLRYITKFGGGFIFNNCPRLRREGFRWAPKSLLGSRVSSLAVAGNEGRVGELKTIGPNFGLVVTFPGAKYKLGLATEMLSVGKRKVFSIAEQDAERDIYYSVELESDCCALNRDATYGLVFSRKPFRAGQESLAMVGSEVRHSDNDEESNTHFLQHECTAVIKGRSGPAPAGTLVLPFYKYETKWMIM